jgi:PAS domain S-box-containing protein
MTLAARLSIVARLAAVFAALVAATALVGWLFHLPMLRSFGFAWRPIGSVSAMCFLLSGAAIALWSGQPGRLASGAAWALTLVVAVLAGVAAPVTVLQIDTATNPLVRAVIGASASLQASDVNHSFFPNTTIPFLLLATGMLNLGGARKSAFDVAGWLGLSVASIALHVLLSYRLLFASESMVQMAPPSAILFLVLGCALAITRLDAGLAHEFGRDRPMASIAWRLLLVGLLAPPLFFTAQAWWSHRLGQEMHSQSVYFSTAYAMAFLGLITVLLRRMFALDRHRNEAEAARNELLARVQQQAANLQFEVSERTFELQESSKRLELALQSSASGVWDWDRATERVIWNERQCTIYGLAPDKFDGRLETWASLLHPEDRAAAEAAMQRALTSGEHFDNAFRIITSSGAVRHIEAHGFAHRDANGKCTRVVGVDRDVTHMRESERALISLAQRLQFVLGSAGYGIWEKDCKTGRVEWDDRMLEINGITRRDLEGSEKDFQRTLHPEDLAASTNMSADVLRGLAENYEDRFRIIRPDGTVRHIEARGFLQRSSNGEPLRVIGLTRDITEDKELREQLRIAEERWKLALAGNNDGLWDWDVVANELYFDNRWAEMLGYGPNEIPRRLSEWERRLNPEDAGLVETAIEAHFAGKTPFYLCEYRLRHKLGHWVWILDRGKLVSRDKQGRPLRVVGTHTDISESKALEKRLRQFEEMALQMGRLAQIGPWDLQVGTQKLTWSPEVYRIHHADLGFEPTFEGMLSFYEPDARATLREAFERAVRQGTPFDLELPIVTAGGQRLWVRFLGKAESKGGSTSHLYGAVQNITEIRESENARRRLETQLFQAQKMETLGTLAGGIAHDFNNLLTGILGYQELALDGLPDDHPSRTCLDSARSVSMRAREMVQQILTLSRRPDNEMATVDLSYVIEEARRFLRTTVPGNVAIETDISPNCGRVNAEATQIHQVLLNLGQNASHAMGATGGTIRISLAPVAVDAHLASALGILVPGAYLRLSISDTGHGMDAETQKRIFDPFFTTKGAGQGTGLGLSVVHGIVRAHRGAITVESAPGKGATFSIYLRRAEGIEEVIDAGDKPVPRGSGELICVVDDEDFVLSCVTKAVDKLGYRAVAFDSPQRCLEALRSEHSDCALLVTDQTMPGMTGTEMAEKARSFAPTLPIIIMSGYFSKISPAILDRVDRVSLVSKPFTSEELASAVHRALHPETKDLN